MGEDRTSAALQAGGRDLFRWTPGRICPERTGEHSPSRVVYSYFRALGFPRETMAAFN